MITKDLAVKEVKNINGKEEKFYHGNVDRIFKTIFVQENDYHLMEALLSSCLGEKVEIIKYLYNELDVTNTMDKEKRTDILIELAGKKVIVEINTEGSKIRNRNFNFITNFYSTRVKRGEKYTDHNKIEYILIDLSYGIYNKELVTYYYIQNNEGKKYVKNFKILEFDMDKIKKECYDKIVKGVEEQYKYLVLLKNIWN